MILPNGRKEIDEDGKPVTTTVLERDSGIFLRGSSKSQVNLGGPSTAASSNYRTDQSVPPQSGGLHARVNADKPVGEERYFMQMRGDAPSSSMDRPSSKTVRCSDLGPIGLRTIAARWSSPICWSVRSKSIHF